MDRMQTVMEKKGNFEGKNILNLLANEAFKEPGMRITALNQEMGEYRSKRTNLHRDDKVLTSWNGLSIAALAKGYQILLDDQYLGAAKKAEQFIMEKLSEENGRLKVRYRDGESIGVGQIDDYAFMVWAELELYRATFETKYLKKAIKMANWMIQLFWDIEKEGFYFYASDAEQLINRPKELYDGAVPSGNSVAAAVLVQLNYLTGEELFRDYAARQLDFLSRNIEEYPAGYSFALLAMLEELYDHQELVCVAEKEEQLEPLRETLAKKFHKNLTVVVKTKENEKELASLCSYTADYPVEEGKTVYYLCRNGACMPKMYELEELPV